MLPVCTQGLVLPVFYIRCSVASVYIQCGVASVYKRHSVASVYTRYTVLPGSTHAILAARASTIMADLLPVFTNSIVKAVFKITHIVANVYTLHTVASVCTA